MLEKNENNQRMLYAFTSNETKRNKQVSKNTSSNYWVLWKSLRLGQSICPCKVTIPLNGLGMIIHEQSDCRTGVLRKLNVK